nr:PilZ domain-containing protein [Desulfobulbaceae bacterium]
MTIDNRQAVRVTGKIPFACSRVSTEKFEKVLADFNEGISLYNREELADVQVYIGAQSSLARLRDKDEDLAAFLQHIDGKLNLLLKKVDNEPSLVDTLVLQRVSIGANGLAFWSDKEFSKNDIVEIYLLLQPEHVFICCFGTVVECVACRGDQVKPDQRYRVSVNLKLIMDADREELVHYNFKQQSLALKQRRIQKEETE